MNYDPEIVQPMRAEMTDKGFNELLTAEDVTNELGNGEGTAIVFVNSVCGCSARQARPGVLESVLNEKKPEKLLTVFAGQDIEATTEARKFFTGYMPSSPQIAIIKDGELVFMMERHEIESRDAEMISDQLKAAFDKYCN
ncbi:MAG: BrxA/BrxB family bacilliredoxin [bacterium]|nr:BrxA/BrxB family bacilliredoxin [bacterium]